MASKLLSLCNLDVRFGVSDSEIRAVRDATFEIAPAEAVGLVGESGCGKSVTALAIMGLLSHPGRIAGGSIRLDGTELTELPPNNHLLLLRVSRLSIS